MNEKELADMLASARKSGLDKKTLDYLNGYVEGFFLRKDPLFNASVFQFNSGYKEKVEL